MLEVLAMDTRLCYGLCYDLCIYIQEIVAKKVLLLEC